MPQTPLRIMPDIANEARPHVEGALDWVGMNEIELPVLIKAHDGTVTQVPARVTAFVNLKQPEVRGIHMSRLYLHLDELLTSEVLAPASLHNVLRAFLHSHADLSDHAFVEIRLDYLVRRPALASDNAGWKRYPVTVRGIMRQNQLETELDVQIAYSSTCPCSAALARQLIQERFERDFAPGQPLDRDAVYQWLGSEQGICATPHSQRSHAQLRLRLRADHACLPIIQVIDSVEEALKTPVQTAVKREDEQAFARLNGENLMFCEDAGRRIQKALNQLDFVEDFWARAVHYESLHPHNAVSVVTKGLPDGYNATRIFDWNA